MTTSTIEPRNEQHSIIDPGASSRRSDAYRNALLRLRAELRGEWTQMNETAEENFARDAQAMAQDVVDRANTSIEQDVTLFLLGSAEEVLLKIDDALARIENGVYGLCEDCATAIPAARLEALPYAAQCVRCAEKAERRRRPR